MTIIAYANGQLVSDRRVVLLQTNSYHYGANKLRLSTCGRFAYTSLGHLIEDYECEYIETQVLIKLLQMEQPKTHIWSLPLEEAMQALCAETSLLVMSKNNLYVTANGKTIDRLSRDTIHAYCTGKYPFLLAMRAGMTAEKAILRISALEDSVGDGVNIVNASDLREFEFAIGEAGS